MARHTYATELLKQGVSVYYVSRLLGHEKLSSTQIYLHPSQDAAIEEAKKVKFFLVQNQLEVNSTPRTGSDASFPVEIVSLFSFLDSIDDLSLYSESLPFGNESGSTTEKTPVFLPLQSQMAPFLAYNGSTTEKCPIFQSHNSISSLILTESGSAKAEALTG